MIWNVIQFPWGWEERKIQEYKKPKNISELILKKSKDQAFLDELLYLLRDENRSLVKEILSQSRKATLLEQERIISNLESTRLSYLHEQPIIERNREEGNDRNTHALWYESEVDSTIITIADVKACISKLVLKWKGMLQRTPKSLKWFKLCENWEYWREVIHWITKRNKNSPIIFEGLDGNFFFKDKNGEFINLPANIELTSIIAPLVNGDTIIFYNCFIIDPQNPWKTKRKTDVYSTQRREVLTDSHDIAEVVEIWCTAQYTEKIDGLENVLIQVITLAWEEVTLDAKNAIITQ